MTAPDYTALLAQGEAALTTINRLRKYDWQDWAAVDVEDAAQIVAGVPALIAAIRELEVRVRESAMQELASLGQAQEAYQAQLAAEAKLAEVEKERDSAKGVGITAIEVAEAHIATLTAQVEAMRGLLKEARDDIAEYVNADYPEEYRAQYPDMDRRYRRDMELCRRIDAALTTENQNG